ncbi:ephrin-B3-like [Passer montanus]|uniref:ephrin-B3-like n=1 Tax=Passer montanus TaxID=9160 RepID=UPI001960DC4A|nr:ephrin-B3-like [Passer montanus]
MVTAMAAQPPPSPAGAPGGGVTVSPLRVAWHPPEVSLGVTVMVSPFLDDGGYVLYPQCHTHRVSQCHTDDITQCQTQMMSHRMSPCLPRFLEAGGYVLYPQIGDRLDLVCPGGAGYEYYKLYLVGGAQARRCQVPPAPTLLLTCDRPQRDVRFTIKFQEFSPNLWGHEFRRQHDYYIITTSDGTREGLENRQGGACLTRAMRVTLRVGQRECPSPAPPPST